MKQSVGIENIKDVLLHLLSNKCERIDEPINCEAKQQNFDKPAFLAHTSARLWIDTLEHHIDGADHYSTELKSEEDVKERAVAVYLSTHYNINNYKS